MAENTQTFVLVGSFRDEITPSLKKLNRTLGALERSLGKGFRDVFKDIRGEMKDISKYAERLGDVFEKRTARSVNKVTRSLTDAARAAGKTRDVVSQIGEGLKGFDGLADSMGGVARAAGRAAEEVEGIGVAAGRANKQADDLMTTLLKAEGLSRFGDAMSQGFNRGMGAMIGTARKGFGIVAKSYRDAMEDEMADIKAQTSVMGAFTRAGYKGSAEGGGLTFGEAGKFYKKFDMQIADLIRTSSAPTGKVIELQRLTMDTLGPLLLAAEGVPKGMDVRKIDPKTISSTAKTYGGMLEQIALLSQGTGSATFRVAQGVEGLIKYGKIDTTMDFFTDNVLLMQALQDAGFAGGRGGGGLKVSSLKTEAERLVALQKAMKIAMAPEGIAAMSTSMLGSLQALGDTISNPQVGLFGMASTFTEEEQKKVNSQVKRLFDGQIQKYKTELDFLNKEKNLTKKQELRKLQLEKDIDKTQKRLDELIKVGDEKVTTPFKAFSLVFGGVIRNFTEVLNTIGPIWNRFAVVGLEWTYKFLQPLSTAFENISSDLRGGMPLSEGVGRIVGEIYKFLGSAMADLAKALTDPTGAMGQIENQFVKGFMSAFKDRAEFEKIKKGFADGMWALITKFLQLLGKVLLSQELRPLVLTGLALAFGPPFISAVIAGATPLVIAAIGKIAMGLVSRAGGRNASSALDAALPGGGRGRRGRYGRGGSIDRLNRMRRSRLGQAARFAGEVPGLGYELMGAPGKKTFGRVGRGLRGIGRGASRLGRMIPGGALAMGALDAGMGMMAGESPGKAIGSAVASTLGAAVGSIFGPVGTMIGGVAGGLIFDKVSSAFDPAAKAMAASAKAMETYANVSGGEKALGITQILADSKAKDLPQVFNELYRNGQLTNTELRRLKDTGFADKVAKLDKINAELEKVKAEELNAERNSLSSLDSIRKRRIELEKQQQAALNSAVKTWESFGANLQQRLITGSNGITRALDYVKAGFMNWVKGLRPSTLEEIRTDPRRALPPGNLPFTPRSPVDMAIDAVFGRRGQGQARGSAHPFMGNLGQAINYEMKNKPPGSDLVIANSSETIIPAADGLNTNMGFKGIVDAVWRSAQSAANTMASGFKMVDNTLRTNHERSTQTMKVGTASTNAAINRSIMMNAAGDRQILAAIKAASAAGGLGGGALGTGSGSLGAASALAQSMGLQITSGYRPGDPGYHGANRARDYSNGTGPTPQMMKFAQTMVAKYGTSLTELIYTPLGFGIKNGKKVPPYAAAAHYNHVHVAFANGPDMPTMFTNAAAAASYERMMAPAGAKVATITANSSESSGGHTTVNQNITINGAQDPQRLAEIVFDYASRAAQRVNNASFA